MATLNEFKPRLPVSVLSDKIIEVLPEHYSTDYPDLVRFLEIYYEYLNKESTGFSNIIQSLYQIRDIDSTSLANLNLLFQEIGNNATTADFFADPRFVAKVIAAFYKNKGTLTSAEGFFRVFFNEEAAVSYPKNSMFIINESKIGTDSLRYIQDDKRYQVHSILITSGVSLATWEVLYKQFVHPAGWYLAGDVVIESHSINADLLSMPISIPATNAGQLIVSETATLSVGADNIITGIISNTANSHTYASRINLLRNINTIGSVTLAQMDDMYKNISSYGDMNGPTFDEDSDGTITNIDNAMDFSNTLETMDGSIFDYWDSDNNVFQYQDSA